MTDTGPTAIRPCGTGLLLTREPPSQGCEPFQLFSAAFGKVEAEAAVRACGYLRVDNARPSFLLGQRAEARTGERVGIVAARMVAPLLIGPLMIYHPIPAASVAGALVNLSFRDEPGVFIQQYSELVAAA